MTTGYQWSRLNKTQQLAKEMGVSVKSVRGTIGSCVACGNAIVLNNKSHRYCHLCARAKDIAYTAARNALKRKNPVSRAKINEQNRALRNAMSEHLTAAGHSRALKMSLSDDFEQPSLAWAARIAVPFDYSLSKNSLYGMNSWQVFRRQKGRLLEAAIAENIRHAIKGMGVKIRVAKLWVSIHVEKSNHRGDAINVIDCVCDALKKGVGLDDRWFCIKHLDWSINRVDPHIIIQFGQSELVDHAVCRLCGLVQPLEAFTKKASSLAGVSHDCKDCQAAARKLRDKAKGKITSASSPLSEAA